MKKALLLAVLVSVLVPSLSLAAATSTPAVASSNGDPMAVVQVWGLTGYQTPIVTCNLWGSLHNKCFDISGTEYFKLANAPVVGLHNLNLKWTPFGLGFSYSN